MPRCIVACGLTLLLSCAVQAQTNTLALPDTSGATDEVLVIPLHASLEDQVSGLTFSILFENSVLQINSVTPVGAYSSFSTETRLTSGRLRVAMAGATPAVGTGPILELEILLKGSPGTTSVLDLSGVILNEGDEEVELTDGLITIVRRATIGGTIQYRQASRPVSVATVTGTDLTDGTLWQSTTLSDGSYVLGPMPPGEYLVSAARTPVEEGAIDPLDVSDILRSLVGYESLSANERRVADVSGNGWVGTTDASLILRYIVGSITDFPAGPFWEFDPEEGLINLLTNKTQNFTAFLLGDVDGSWEAGAPPFKLVAIDGPALSFTSAEPVEDATRFTVRGDGLTRVRGGIVQLSFDADALEATAISKGETVEGFMLAANLDEPGQVRIAFAGADEVDGSGPLLHVDFRELGQAGNATPVAIESASLNGVDLFGDALGRTVYTLGSAHHNVPTAVSEESAVLPGEATLSPAYPNPFNASTVLEYRLDAAATVELTLFGADGHRVRRLVSGTRAAGLHRVTWDGRDDGGREAASGTYFAHLQVGGHGATRSLMLLR